MSTPKVEYVPTASTTTTQTAVGSGNSAADTAAATAKKTIAAKTDSKSILTSGSGVIDEAQVKKNLLG